MADKVHPNGDSSHDPESAPAPPQQSYVIQVPKDQIFRVPPPENQRRFDRYTSRAQRRRSRCRRCCCCVLATLLILVLALAATATTLYLVFRPKLPHYSIDSLSIKGLDLNSTTLADRSFSLEFDATILARNPNKKIGFYYKDGSSIDVYYSDIRLCGGQWPVFYQGRMNETVVRVALVGDGIQLSGEVQSGMRAEEKKRAVPIMVYVRVPVRIRFGAVKIWKMTAKLRCAVTVDRLAAGSRVLSKTCSFKMKVF